MEMSVMYQENWNRIGFAISVAQFSYLSVLSVINLL